MNNIIHIIQHSARAATVLLATLLTAYRLRPVALVTVAKE